MKMVRYSFLFLIICILTGCLKTSREAPTEIADKYGDIAVLYGTNWCGYCEKTRELFKRNNIEYIDYDIETSREGKFEFDKLGGKGIPLVLIKGRLVEGYVPKTVLELAKGTVPSAPG